MKTMFIFIIGILFAAPLSWGQGLKDAGWHASTPKRQAYTQTKEKIVTIGKVEDNSALEAKIKRSLGLILKRLSLIKIQLVKNEKISPRDIMFLFEVAKHHLLKKYIDNRLWELIAGVDADWARQLLAENRDKHVYDDNELVDLKTDQTKDIYKILELAGSKKESGSNSFPQKFVGPNHSGKEANKQRAYTEKQTHDGSGFNAEQKHDWKRKLVKDRKGEPERYEWQRDYKTYQMSSAPNSPGADNEIATINSSSSNSSSASPSSSGAESSAAESKQAYEEYEKKIAEAMKDIDPPDPTDPDSMKEYLETVRELAGDFGGSGGGVGAIHGQHQGTAGRSSTWGGTSVEVTDEGHIDDGQFSGVAGVH
ncbi:hypothetical protein ACFLRA_01910 [Bdellovibrionota bacterium]